MKRIAYTFALMLVLVGSAVAQSGTQDKQPNSLWAGFSLSVYKMEGVEASTGILDKVDEVYWGRTYIVRNEEATFTLSLNYNYEKSSVAGAPSETMESELSNPIVGGTWTMVVYKGGELKGMLFGEFTGGTMTWKLDRAGNEVNCAIKGDLYIKGGTQDFAKVGGKYAYGRFNGNAEYTTGTIPTTTGSVDLMF
jgi:hypothetical protein